MYAFRDLSLHVDITEPFAGVRPVPSGSAASNQRAHEEKFVGKKGIADKGGNFLYGCAAGNGVVKPHLCAKYPSISCL